MSRIRNLLVEMKKTFKAGGLKGLFQVFGWKLLLGIFLYYLIRDVTLYIIIPWLVLGKVFHFSTPF